MDNVTKKNNKYWQANKHWICKVRNYNRESQFWKGTLNAYQEFQDTFEIIEWVCMSTVN